MDTNDLSNYIFLDVETPNGYNDSICSIGLVYGNGEQRQYLVNPHDFFSQRNIQIHHIQPGDVEKKDDWKTVWNKIGNDISSKIVVAYNALFDLRVISKALYRSNITPPTFRYIDMMKITKVLLPEIAGRASLNNVCDYLNIPLEEHHDSLQDAEACRNIFLQLNVEDICTDFYNPEERIDSSTLRAGDVQEYSLEQSLSEVKNICGLLLALMTDLSNESIPSSINCWYRQNLLTVNDAVKEICPLIQQIIDSDYSKDSLEFIFNDYSDSVYSLMSVYSFLIHFNDIHNKQPYYLQLHNLLNELPVKERPGNYANLIQKTQEVLDNPEKENELKKEITRFLKSLDTSDIENLQVTIKEKSFVLTGNFCQIERSKLAELIKQKGGYVKASVSKKIDYVVIGSCPSDKWKCGTKGGGSKIQRAIELNITKISESDFLKVLLNAEDDDSSDVPF